MVDQRQRGEGGPGPPGGGDGGGSAPRAGDPRSVQIAANLARVRSRIADACAAASRAPDEVTLIAVTKTYPAADVMRLAALGVRDVGENRDQEAAPKAVEVATAGVAVHWHFVGRLQRNKCRSVVEYAGTVHSVDSVPLAQALGSVAQRRDRIVDVLVQVSVDADPARGGAMLGAAADPARDLMRVAREVAGAAALRLRGVMAVAPLDWAPEAAFARLAEIAGRLRAEYPDAGLVSAGMSGDLDAAVRYGATHLRIGTALLGNRATLR